MRWKIKEKTKEENIVQSYLGDTRIKHGFLWLPKCIKKEIRWLECSSWKEQAYLAKASEGIPYLRWIGVKWIEYVGI